ncbi:ComF family protein [Oceanicoccus sp. KOV_DT_Chl]|uniref:ComF family protein n=1 Tax=Oceanicoccus sp. KOV_DT_Chl TaxID=1904639 RepID=UPI000C7E5B6D|nr:ComF family protein [Oceanicoccus sp. KOV_DT_Chl]
MVNRFFHSIKPLLTLGQLSQCILCAAHGQQQLDLCTACEQELPWLGHHCQRCALPLSQPSAKECGLCQQHPPPFARTVASFAYGPPIAQMISGLKHNKHYGYGRTLCFINTRMIASAYLHSQLPDLIMPTPLHWSRRLIRGFNQSDLLAQDLSQKLGIPLRHGLIRHKRTPAQQSLNAQQRRRNLRGAFAVKADIVGQRIALIDDVMTTGATVREISQLLIKAGAAEVHVWVLARTAT